MLHLREERMSDFFVKWHIEGLPRSAVLHEFTAPDGGDPHDHPFAFQSYIVCGGYVEQVFELDGSSRYVEHHEGESFLVKAGHIHRIVELYGGYCATLITPRQHERKPGFYQFRDDGTYHRFWDQREFAKLGT